MMIYAFADRAEERQAYVRQEQERSLRAQGRADLEAGDQRNPRVVLTEVVDRFAIPLGGPF